MQSLTDTEKRLTLHFEGKLHTGYALIRKTLAEIKQRREEYRRKKKKKLLQRLQKKLPKQKRRSNQSQRRLMKNQKSQKKKRIFNHFNTSLGIQTKIKQVVHYNEIII